MLYLRHPDFFQGGNPAHWAHASTKDLVHWVDHPYALKPGPDTYDRRGVWSGAAVDADGVATVVYTGKTHEGTYEDAPGFRPEVQCIATSTDEDLETWTKHPANPVIANPPEGLDITAFRDPHVWREDDGWRMLIGSGIRGSGGTVLLYRSQNLVEWEYLGQLFTAATAQTGWAWEVPDFFPLSDKWVLTLMPITSDGEAGCVYYIGEYDGSKFIPERSGLLDSGWIYRAPESFWAPDARRLVFAWLFEERSMQARARAGWSGTASVPRALAMGDDGGLRITPVRELQTLRGDHDHAERQSLASGRDAWRSEVQGTQLEIAAEFERGSAEAVELRVLCAPDGSEATIVRYDWTAHELTLDTTRSSLNTIDGVGRAKQVAGVGRHSSLAAALTEPPFSLMKGENLSLRVFVDRSIVEVFANERSCSTGRVYPTRRDSIGVSATAEGGQAGLVSADVWTMASIW
jgi:beta-fructofuranosidase